MSCRSNCSNNSGCSNNCAGDSSACALKNILDCLDDLNNQDLCILKEVIARILSCRC